MGIYCSCGLIRYAALFLRFYSGFTNGEYRIALVDFIAPCGGTKEWGRRDLRIPPSPPSGLPPFQPWGIAAAGYWAAAGLGQFRNPVSGASRLSPLRREDWVLCVRAWTVRVSVGLVGLVSFVFHYWGKKDAVCLAFTHVFLITADREMVPILSGASPFHQIGWVEPYWKKAFVRLKLLMI